MTYNHEKYIEDALKGLLAQDYPNMELIILDDASSDNTVGIIESYMGKLEAKFDRVVKMYHDSNAGNISKNQNELVAYANGEYIVGLSGDDVYMCGAVKKMVDVLQQHSECSMAYMNMQIVDAEWHYDECKETKMWNNAQESGIQNHLFERLMRENCIAAPSVIIKRNVYEHYGLHDESILFEDYEYWLRISRTEKVYYCSSPVVYYRFSDDSISNYVSDISCKKLNLSMEADYLTKKKYISVMPYELQKICWESFFRKYRKLCDDISYEQGLRKINDLMLKEGIKLDSRDSADCLLKRKTEENQILYSWLKFKNKGGSFKQYFVNNHINTIGIYGFANLGRQLYDELLKENINVSYVIDKMGNMINTNVDIKTLNDELSEVDVVIVTVFGLSDSELDYIKRATKSNLLKLRDLFAL